MSETLRMMWAPPPRVNGYRHWGLVDVWSRWWSFTWKRPPLHWDRVKARCNVWFLNEFLWYSVSGPVQVHVNHHSLRHQSFHCLWTGLWCTGERQGDWDWNPYHWRITVSISKDTRIGWPQVQQEDIGVRAYCGLGPSERWEGRSLLATGEMGFACRLLLQYVPLVRVPHPMMPMLLRPKGCQKETCWYCEVIHCCSLCCTRHWLSRCGFGTVYAGDIQFFEAKFFQMSWKSASDSIVCILYTCFQIRQHVFKRDNCSVVSLTQHRTKHAVFGVFVLQDGCCRCNRDGGGGATVSSHDCPAALFSAYLLTKHEPTLAFEVVLKIFRSISK